MITSVSYGGGVNSTAMLFVLWNKNERPDYILFADTGGEKPETYEFIEFFSDWLRLNNMPEIKIISNGKETLEEECLRLHNLPSVAYGFKSCSDHFKLRPQKRYLKMEGYVDIQWLIGFDRDEVRRAKDFDKNRYPLIEWGWDREICKDVILKKLKKLPPKSSCFFCPNSKKQEVLKLAKDHPDLMARAIKMEENAQLTFIKGLGRNYAWKDLIDADERQQKLFQDNNAEMPCECIDGNEE